MKDLSAIINYQRKVEYLSKEVSTLEYLSNLQYIDTSVPNDTRYMRFVHDPFALEQMKKLIEAGQIKTAMTDIQEKEMKNASGHCAFAYKDDYPWVREFPSQSVKVSIKAVRQSVCQI